MKITQPRITVASVAAEIDGKRRPAPQPLGTWMTRWYHMYRATPAIVEKPEFAFVPQLNRSAA